MASTMSTIGNLAGAVAPLTGPASPFVTAGGAILSGIGGALEKGKAAKGVREGAGKIQAGYRIAAQEEVDQAEEIARSATANAQLANEDAALAEVFSQYRGLEIREAGERAISGTRAATSAAGVRTDAGSPLLAVQVQAQQAAKAALYAEYEGMRQAKRLRLEATESMKKALLARESARRRAQTVLFQGKQREKQLEEQARAGEREGLSDILSIMPSLFKLGKAGFKAGKSFFGSSVAQEGKTYLGADLGY